MRFPYLWTSVSDDGAHQHCCGVCTARREIAPARRAGPRASALMSRAHAFSEGLAADNLRSKDSPADAIVRCVSRCVSNLSSGTNHKYQ